VIRSPCSLAAHIKPGASRRLQKPSAIVSDRPARGARRRRHRSCLRSNIQTARQVQPVRRHLRATERWLAMRSRLRLAAAADQLTHKTRGRGRGRSLRLRSRAMTSSVRRQPGLLVATRAGVREVGESAAPLRDSQVIGVGLVRIAHVRAEDTDRVRAEVEWLEHDEEAVHDRGLRRAGDAGIEARLQGSGRRWGVNRWSPRAVARSCRPRRRGGASVTLTGGNFSGLGSVPASATLTVTGEATYTCSNKGVMRPPARIRSSAGRVVRAGRPRKR
jgi:hypothetical protein